MTDLQSRIVSTDKVFNVGYSKFFFLDVAKILKIPVEAIKNFDDQAAVNVISSTFNDNASVNSNRILNINPVEKWLEALEENKRLYEALLKSEREKVAMLEKMLNKK